MRSGKVRYNAISGWLPELRMPHSNLLSDWLFPSVFGFRSVRGRNKNTQKFSLRLRLSYLTVGDLGTRLGHVQ